MRDLEEVLSKCKEALVHEAAVVPEEKIVFSDEVRNLRSQPVRAVWEDLGMSSGGGNSGGMQGTGYEIQKRGSFFYGFQSGRFL